MWFYQSKYSQCIENYYHNCKSMKNKRDCKGFDIFSTCKSSPSDICEKQEVTSEHAPLQAWKFTHPSKPHYSGE